MTLDQLLRKKCDDIKRIAARHGAYNLRGFGSVARGEVGPESDIALLIDAGPTTSSWFPAGVILDLEDLLGRRVEDITEKALNPELCDHVLREAIPLCKTRPSTSAISWSVSGASMRMLREDRSSSWRLTRVSGIDLKRVWETIQRDVPTCKRAISAMLGQSA